MVSIVRYEPFSRASRWGGRPFDTLFDRLVDDTFGRVSPSRGRNIPAANLYDTEEAYLVELPLPGVRPEDLEITVQQSTLTLNAKPSWRAPENAQVIWQSFAPARWQHSLTLPGEVNAEAVEAALEHGVLRLRLPKAAHLRPQSIKVQATHGARTTIEAQNGEAHRSETATAEAVK